MRSNAFVQFTTIGLLKTIQILYLPLASHPLFQLILFLAFLSSIALFCLTL